MSRIEDLWDEVNRLSNQIHVSSYTEKIALDTINKLYGEISSWDAENIATHEWKYLGRILTNNTKIAKVHFECIKCDIGGVSLLVNPEKPGSLCWPYLSCYDMKMQTLLK